MTTLAPPAAIPTIYRSPGRPSVRPPIKPPSWTTLAVPAWRALGVVGLCLAPPLLFRVCVARSLAEPGVRLVPLVGTIEDAFAILALASLPVLVVVLVRRVVPIWAGMTALSKIAYVTGLLLVQLLVLGAAEASLAAARGGFELFAPRLVVSSVHGIHRAYVYESGLLGCSYDVYVAEPHAILMPSVVHVDGAACAKPTPHVRWLEGGGVELDRPDGAPVTPEPIGPLFSWGGC